MLKNNTPKFTIPQLPTSLVQVLGFVILILIFLSPIKAQICGTSGIDGPSTNTNPINTYYPIPTTNDIQLPSGSTSITLDAVPQTNGNNYGNIGIRAGDLILIIQMQDATINYENNAKYGAGLTNSGADGLGGTGYLNIGFSGIFEYVIALNNVPLTGGTLNFRGGGLGGGTVKEYYNAAPTASRGQRRFQIVRVPQYSNLILTSDITTVPYDGRAGGVIAFDVAGDMNFGGFKIDASKRGFRGGFGPNQGGDPGVNKENIYAVSSSSTKSVGKGEGIAGTPRYMYDGYNDFNNGIEGLPGGSYGKGAPANGGGGGNDHNAGGGGGGNGGQGGNGGRGWEGAGGTYPNGGRPGINLPQDLTRLIMGGGGGGGDANNALSGVRGGIGGGIVLVNVEKIVGTGTILANGGDGQRGIFGSNPDGAGGGAAGGTIFIRSLTNSTGATLTLQANGGKGGDTEQDNGNEHGPGGGGGGGVIYHNVPGATINSFTNRGKSGRANAGAGISHYAEDGTDGLSIQFTNDQLPSYLQGGGQTCYPELTTTLTEAKPGTPGSRNPGTTATYTLTIANSASGGNAGGVQAQLKLPIGFTITSVTATLNNGSAGPANPPFTLVGNVYEIGDANLVNAYNITPDGSIVFTINVDIDNDINPGMYHSSAQATYLDPTRTLNNPNRIVTAQNNAFASTNTAYETGTSGTVKGINYDGNQIIAIGEDVHINAKPKPDNFEMDVIECNDKAEGQLTATDPDQAHTPQNLKYSIEGNYETSKGTLTLNNDGTFKFVPLERFFGTITIQFRVTDHLGAYDLNTLKINQPKPLLDISETISHISAYNANDGAISIISSGGVGVHSYSWLFPDGSIVNSQNINNLSPGSYKLTITDQNNCRYSEEYLIREPPIITLTPNQSICVGENNIDLPYTNPRVNPNTYSVIWDSNAKLAGLTDITDAILPSIIAPNVKANINISIPTNILAATYNGILKVKNAAGDSSSNIQFHITITAYPEKAHIQLIQ